MPFYMQSKIKKRRELALPEDSEHLSPYECLVREQFEVFEVPADVAKVFGRPSSRPQVGLRCKHCIFSSYLGRGATCFPSNLEAVRSDVMKKARTHFVMTKGCPMIPKEVLQELVELREKGVRSSRLGADHWKEGCYIIGMFEESNGMIQLAEGQTCTAVANQIGAADMDADNNDVGEAHRRRSPRSVPPSDRRKMDNGGHVNGSNDSGEEEGEPAHTKSKCSVPSREPTKRGKTNGKRQAHSTPSRSTTKRASFGTGICMRRSNVERAVDDGTGSTTAGSTSAANSSFSRPESLIKSKHLSDKECRLSCRTSAPSAVENRRSSTTRGHAGDRCSSLHKPEVIVIDDDDDGVSTMAATGSATSSAVDEAQGTSSPKTAGQPHHQPIQGQQLHPQVQSRNYPRVQQQEPCHQKPPAGVYVHQKVVSRCLRCAGCQIKVNCGFCMHCMILQGGSDNDNPYLVCMNRICSAPGHNAT